MNRLFSFIIFYLFFGGIDHVFAIATRAATQTEKATKTWWSVLTDAVIWLVSNAINIVLFVIIVWIMLRLLRLAYEVLRANDLVYMRVTLPRADSKLDKEKETKKDFKEKAGIMTVFYKSIHNLTQASAWDTFMNFIFRHAKISLELFFHDGQVHFYAVGYREHASLIVQQITSNYPDAEVKVITKKDMPEIKPIGFTLQAASVGKTNDDIYPIKTYKYFEDDPLSSFTNNFGSLKKTDSASIQFVLKPLGHSWNRRAKKAAGLVAKGEYKKGVKFGLLGTAFKTITAPISWLLFRFIKNEETGTNAPGATSGDSYKIFNQAEQEAQKMVGESAGQPGFQGSIRVLVASDTAESTRKGLLNLIAATSIFTDEYNNRLDNPQMLEDTFRFIFTPLRYFAYKFRLVGVFQSISRFSSDELTTMFHFPDINYNKSPIISWLDYKMLAVPPNLKIPKEPLILKDYKRDANGNIFTQDGSILKVDKNKNLLRDEQKNLVLLDGTVVPVFADGENIGKPMDEGKTPVQVDAQRKLQGFPLYKDAALLGWNEYRNVKTPIYFAKKDRGRHHYIIGKSG